MAKSTTWQLLIAVAGLVLVAGLLWWATFPSPQSTTEVPAHGGTYIEGIVGQPKYLNPVLGQPNSVDQDIASLVFSGLTKLTSNGAVEPDLAEKWQVSPDGKVYLFDLRHDAKWHDGSPVTADDVVFTVKTIQDPDYQGNPAVAQLWKNVAVERVSDEQVKFTLKDAYAPFLEYATQPLIPAQILGGVPAKKLPEHRFNMYPLGTGPFKVTEASLKEVVLEANPDYYGEKPFLDQIRFRFYPDGQAALSALRRDEVEGVGYLSPEDVQLVKTDTRINVFAAPEFSKQSLLIMNTKSAVFADKAVRQAIAYAIDRPKLIDIVENGQGVEADSPVIPVSWAYNREVKKYDHRPMEAKNILDNAGWRDTDGDAVRDKNGQKLAFVLLTNDNPRRVKAAEEISRELQEVGIKVTVQAAGWSGFIRDFLAPRKFEAALVEQWSPGADPDSYQFWHSSQAKGDGLNFASWTNRQADDLLENARRSNDQAERARLYRDFQSLFAEEEPSVLLYYPVFDYAVSKSVKGVDLGLLLDPSHRFDKISEWYVKTKRVPLNQTGKS
ncbi:MAG: ABC transporter substrate-binding protein [Dehalococcoidales bacterium]|nr:ABC transporter substrate-binding protein [Dehalococcoidales bacterium]